MPGELDLRPAVAPLVAAPSGAGLVSTSGTENYGEHSGKIFPNLVFETSFCLFKWPHRGGIPPFSDTTIWSLASEAKEKTQAQETQEGQEERTTFRPNVFVACEETVAAIFLNRMYTGHWWMTDADLGQK